MVETLTAERTQSIPLSDLDPIRAALLTALETAPHIREKHGRGLDGLKAIGKLLEDVPTYMLASHHADVVDLDIAVIGQHFIDTLPEFAMLRGFPIRYVWKRKAGAGGGKVTLGTCAVTSSRFRMLWPGNDPAPWWEITIALDAWLLASENERLWLVHHELGHANVDVDDEGEASPSSRGHDVEEFYSSAGRFGPKDTAALRLARLTLAHPDAETRGDEWAGDEDGQQWLFSPYMVAAS